VNTVATIIKHFSCGVSAFKLICSDFVALKVFFSSFTNITNKTVINDGIAAMKKHEQLRLKEGIYGVSFRYNTNLGAYATLMSDIPKLGAMHNLYKFANLYLGMEYS
jgi:hypothetical protein